MFLVTCVGIVAVFYLGPASGAKIVLSSVLLGAAAALNVRGANLPPSHILLGAFFLDLVRRNVYRTTIFAALSPRQPGFWLAVSVMYGCAGAIVFPRFFAGQVDVFAISRDEIGVANIVRTPLGPVSGNITQSLYFVADLVCYLAFFAFTRSRAKLEAVAQGILICAYLNLIFAAADLITYYTGTGWLLDPLRNASYSMLVGVEMEGLKRIAGSFPEASTFAYVSIGLFLACLNMWLNGLYPRAALIASLLTLIAILICTSTTGYVGVALVIPVQLAIEAFKLSRRKGTLRGGLFLVFVPLALVIVTTAVFLITPAREFLSDLANTTIFDKLSSQSGLERTAWNRQAIETFWATNTFGAGVGSVRGSSFIAVLLGTSGILGSLTYAVFIASVLSLSFKQEVRNHAHFAGAICIAQLLTSLLGAGSVDLGLLFFAMAGCTAGWYYHIESHEDERASNQYPEEGLAIQS